MRLTDYRIGINPAQIITVESDIQNSGFNLYMFDFFNVCGDA